MLNCLAVLSVLLALVSAPQIFAAGAAQSASSRSAAKESSWNGGQNAGLEPPEDSGYAEAKGVKERTAWGAPSGTGLEGEKPPAGAEPPEKAPPAPAPAPTPGGGSAQGGGSAKEAAKTAPPAAADAARQTNAATPAQKIRYLSAGGRIFYNGMFDIHEYKYEGYSGEDWGSHYGPTFFDNHGFGISGFFDATYVEIGLDFIFGSFKSNSSVNYGSLEITGLEITSTHFGFSILGKYPFVLGKGKAVLFPLLGIDYQIFISGKMSAGDYSDTIDRDDLVDTYEFKEDMLDAFSIVAGAGLDYNLTDRFYLRGELLANFKIDGEFGKDLRQAAKNAEVDLSLFTFGLRVSIGLGYKL